MTSDKKGAVPQDWDYSRLAGIGRRYGTPVHVLDAGRLDVAVEALHRALGRIERTTNVYYSVKTNYLPFLCRRLAQHGLGADVVSDYEMSAALFCGFAPSDMVFNGPVKTEGELNSAVRNGIQVNLDGEGEIATLNRLARKSGKIVDVGIRLSPGRPVSTSVDPSYRAQTEQAAKRNRFGWPVGSEQLSRVLAAIEDAPNLVLTAVHAHLGSQIVHEELMLQALELILTEAGRLHRRSALREVNIGGGFGVAGIRRPRVGPLGSLWSLGGGDPVEKTVEPRFELARFLVKVDQLMDQYGLAGVALACEPGRWLVSDSMVTLTQVMVRKELPYSRWLILDAGNNVVPWTGTGENHRMVPIGRSFSGARISWSVAGPLCYENDIHDLAVKLPVDIVEGDLICVHDTGAYSLGRSNNFIRRRAGIVVLDGTQEHLAWRAETDADIFCFADAAHIGADPQ